MAKIVFYALCLCLLVPSLCFAKAEFQAGSKNQDTRTQPTLPEMPLEHQKPCDLNYETEEMLRRIEEFAELNCNEPRQPSARPHRPGMQDHSRRSTLFYGCG